MDFDVSQHRALIQRRGERLLWSRSEICPCNDPITAMHDRECTICGGVGYIYTPVDVSAFHALVRTVDERSDYLQYGTVLVGDITITTMPDEIPIMPGDLIGLPDRAFAHNEVIVASGEESDLLNWGPAAKLISARSSDGVYSISGDSPDIALSSDGSHIEWLEPPLSGLRVSVSYARIPYYLVLPAMISTRRKIGSDGSLPQRVVARLKNRDDYKK